MKMNKKTLIPAVFLCGMAFGALASEIASNGLYIFKSGDPILASEVNSNFDLLYNMIEEVKLLDLVTNTSYYCDGDISASGYFQLSSNYTVRNNDLFASATSWSFDRENQSFILNSIPETELKISPKENDATYEIRIEPTDSSIEKVSCYRT